MKPIPRQPRARQGGFMLLEALIAILIFSLGVLALVGLQAVSIRQSSEAKYRADATMLANEVIARMWVTDRSFATINTQFVAGGTEFDTWLARVQAALPGATANPPTVTPAPAGLATDPSTQVTVQVNWKSPNDAAADPVHSVTVMAQIK